MDEPLAGLDASTQTLIIELLRKLREAKKPLIFATHNEELVQTIADTACGWILGRLLTFHNRRRENALDS